MKEAPYAWVVVWATFVCLALIFGVSYSFAAFFESFAEGFSAQRADVSWIFGLSGLVYFVLGTLGGILADRFGPRVVCAAGMVLIALGLLATSWASALWMVYLSYGLLVGLGIAFVYTPSIASVQPWFSARRGLAGGIASSGVGAGTLLVPVLVALALDAMPWREAMRWLALAVLGLGLLAAGLLRRAPALAQVARRAGRGDVFPAGPSTQPPRDNMIEGQVVRAAAILAGKAIAQEQVEAGEGGKGTGFDEFAQRDHRRDLHRPARRVHFAVIACDDVDPLQHHGLDRRLPRPQAERIVGQRGVIGVEHQRRAIGQVPGGILLRAAEPGRALDQLRLEHGLR